MGRLIFVGALLLLTVAARGDDDSGHLKPVRGGNPSKCIFQNGRWFCPGGGGNPPQDCRCCHPVLRPLKNKACTQQCALVDCAPPVPLPVPVPLPLPCNCCGSGPLPVRCRLECAAVGCPKPPTPPVDPCGCCIGFRKRSRECDRICAARFCPPPKNCGCCTPHPSKAPECGRICALSLCAAPVPLPVPVPHPPKCDCCGSGGRKYAEGTNTNSLTIAGPICNCLDVLCPHDD